MRDTYTIQQVIDEVPMDKSIMITFSRRLFYSSPFNCDGYCLNRGLLLSEDSRLRIKDSIFDYIYRLRGVQDTVIIFNDTLQNETDLINRLKLILEQCNFKVALVSVGDLTWFTPRISAIPND